MLIRYAKNSVKMMLITAVFILKNLILLPIITRIFGTFNFGVYSIIDAAGHLLYPVSDLGMTQAVTRFYAGEKKANVFSATRMALWLNLLTVSGITLALMMFSGPIAEAILGGAENDRYVFLIGWVTLGLLVTFRARELFKILDDAKSIIIMDTLLSLIPLVLNIIIVIMFKGDIWMILFLFNFIIIALGSIFLYRGLKEQGKGAAWPWKELPKLMRFSLPLILAGYATWVMNGVDRFFINGFLGMDAVGVYSLAYTLGSGAITVLFQPLWMMFPARLTELYNGNRLDELKDLADYSLRAALGIMMPVGVILVVLARPMLSVIGGPEFCGGAGIMAWIVLAYLFLHAGAYPAEVMRLNNRTYLVLWGFLLAAFLNIFLNFMLIPGMGLNGAAIATALSMLAWMLYFIIFSRGVVKLRFSWDNFAKILIACAVIYCLLSFAVHKTPLLSQAAGGGKIYFAEVIGVSAAYAFTGLCVYVLVLVWLKPLLREETDKLTQGISNRLIVRIAKAMSSQR